MHWVIYLAMGPLDAAWVQRPDEEKYDLTKYLYPKYIGYIYTDDFKTIKWHAEVGFAKRIIKEWAKGYSKYPLEYMDGFDFPIPEVLPGSKKMAWELPDPEFFDAAILLIRRDTLMIPIRYERNVPIDKEWKPTFPKQVRIIGTPAESRDALSRPVTEANDQLERKDYIPTNWDLSKNAKRGNQPGKE